MSKRSLIVFNHGSKRFDYDGVFGGTVSEGPGEETSGLGAAVPDGVQFC